MSQFGYSDYPDAIGTLASSNTKITPASSTTNQVEHELIVAVNSDQYVEVTIVEDRITADTVTGVTLTCAYSFQDEGGAEGTITDFGTRIMGDTAVGCTNNTFDAAATKNVSGTPLHRGQVGKDVTIRTYLRTTSVVNTPAMCSRDALHTGRKIRRVSHTFNRQFKGAF